MAKAIVEDRNGNLWIGGSEGLSYVDAHNKTFTFFGLAELGLPMSSSITSLTMNREENLVLGSSFGQVQVWDTSNSEVIAKTELQGKGRVYVSRLAMDDNKLVIGTDNGLYISDEDLSSVKEVQGASNSATTTDVYSLHRDGKYTWVGTINGLDILTFAPFDLFNNQNSGVSNHAISFSQDYRDRIWVGTYSGLFVYDEEDGIHIRRNFSVSTNTEAQDDQRIVAQENRSEYLWIGLFDGGVKKLRLYNNGQLVQIENELDKMSVTRILADENGEDIWVATFDDGLFRINSETLFSYYETKELPEASITSMFRSSTGIFLVASGSRIYQRNFVTGEFHEISFDYGLTDSNPLIYSIAQSINYDILIGTKDYGLYVWRRKDQLNGTFELQPPPLESGLKSSTIYAIEVDSSGNLWCSTQNGIVKLDSNGRLLKRFTTADGLQGNDFTLGASFKSREGLMYFGGTNGYNRFDPESIEIDDHPSPMKLTGISLPTLEDRDLKDVANLKSIELTHRDRFVTFQFSVLDFVDPDRNQFRYTLDNFDSDWVENGGDNTATYTNLPPGGYVFRAQGANSAGIWNRDGISLQVTVLPSPWRTWWAYTLYVFFLLGFVWGLHRIYRSYLIERKSTQLALEMFEAENKADDDMQEQLEIQDDLVRSSYQHNLTTLGLVGDSIRLRSANPLEDRNQELAKRTLDQISALFGLEDCLSYQAGGAVANLYKYTEMILPKLLDQSPVSTETIVTINDVTSLPIPAEYASPLSIAIYELLENCIQHAFPANSPANYIHIKLSPGSTQAPNAHCYELTVHDSGIGLPDSIENLAIECRGIAIVHFIANKLCGKIEILKGGGTTLCLTIPTTDTF